MERPGSKKGGVLREYQGPPRKGSGAAPRQGAPEPFPPELCSLTPRELDVMLLLAKGNTNKQIASALFISEHTVKNHVSNIYKKLRVYDRTQLALLAIKWGLVKR